MLKYENTIDQIEFHVRNVCEERYVLKLPMRRISCCFGKHVFRYVNANDLLKSGCHRCDHPPNATAEI